MKKLIFILCFLLFPVFVYAGGIEIAWDKLTTCKDGVVPVSGVTECPVIEYNLYIGTESGVYSTTIVIDINSLFDQDYPTYYLNTDSLMPGDTYYLAITASNSAGESGFSNEISWKKPTVIIVPDEPKNCFIQAINE